MPNYPSRCQHIKVDGIQCGSPSLRRNRYCFFHKRYHEQRIHLSSKQARRNRSFDLPVLEDANSVQVALMQVLRMIATGDIDQRSAALMLYALQTASNNLRNVRFEPIDGHDVILDPREARDTPLFASEQWCDEDYMTEAELEEQAEQAKKPAKMDLGELLLARLDQGL
ncbi:MAG: hypothetical protein H0X25_19725 [Acidobacteriales bacterium]|nr:hypothetical protein [Terriglobales bacterium]